MFKKYILIVVFFLGLTLSFSQGISEVKLEPRIKNKNVILKPRRLTFNVHECKNCHLKRFRKYIPKAHIQNLTHQNISIKHGDLGISCNSCHDINNFNDLISTTEFPATFEHPSPLCGQCHSDIYKDWTLGIHTKRSGGWNQEREQFHCVECHSPHLIKASFRR